MSICLSGLLKACAANRCYRLKRELYVIRVFFLVTGTGQVMEVQVPDFPFTSSMPLSCLPSLPWPPGPREILELGQHLCAGPGLMC